jgi:hypothetical protein
MKVSVVHRLSVVSVAAIAMTASANASAAHSYGVYINSSISGYADQGSALYQDVNVLTSSCSEFVDHEMWYGVVSGGAYWVEIGLTSGTTPNGCQGGIIFWADNRNGGGYNEHYPGNYGVTNTWYRPLIQEQSGGSCSWDVWWQTPDNTWHYQGTSTSNCPGSGRYLASGIETTTTAGSQLVRGYQDSWIRLDNTRTWQNGWPGAGFYQNSPPYIQWTDGSDTETEEVLNEGF